MTRGEFEGLLAAGGTVPLTAAQWDDLASHYSVEERHPTQLAGDLLIIVVGEDLAAVESPSRDARVARILGGPDQARTFVEKRMEEYERMWDGCGVKVDYFGDS